MSAFWNTLGKHARRSPKQLQILQNQQQHNATLFASARSQTLRMLPTVGDREVVNIAHGLASAGLCSSDEWAGLWDALETSCTSRMGSFSEQGLINVVWAFATAGRDVPNLYTKATDQIVERLDDLTTQGLANAAWAFASANHEAPEYFHALTDLVATKGADEFKAQELCNVIWALATIGHADEHTTRVFSVASHYLMARLDEFSTQGIANSLWSFATLNHSCQELFEFTATAIIPRLPDFNQQELSLTAWAYATMDLPAPHLFDAIAAEATRRVREFKPQGVSNLAWAYATTGHPAPRMFDALADALARDCALFEPKGLAITTWALATVNYNANGDFLDTVFGEAARRIDSFNQQGLSNLAWAAATLNNVSAPEYRPFRTAALYEAIATQCVHVLDTFNQQGLANLLWAYAKQTQRADALFETVVPYVTRAAEEGSLTMHSLVSIVWAYAVLGYAPPELFGPIARAAHRQLDELTAQGLANLGWAYAVADVVGPDIDVLFGDGAFVERCALIIGEGRAHSSEGSNAYEHLRQLHQWQLWREECAVAAAQRDEPEAVWPGLPEPMRAEAAKMFASLDGRPSEFQRQVADVCAELGLSPVQEVVSSLGYSLDIVVRLPTGMSSADSCRVADDAVWGAADDSTTWVTGGDLADVDGDSGCRIREDAGVFPGDAASDLVAIEVDGPTHFLFRSTRPTGSTLLKRRQLQRAGWCIRWVPFFGWQNATRYARNREERDILRRQYIAELVGIEWEEPRDEALPVNDQ